MSISLEKLCQIKNIRMTEQRKIVARLLYQAKDHPNVEELYQRALQYDASISLTTIYRTLKLFEEQKLIERHDFKEGSARYEIAHKEHHDHLIDIDSGKVIEFKNDEIEKIQKYIADQLGYKLVGHRLELYGMKKK